MTDQETNNKYKRNKKNVRRKKFLCKQKSDKITGVPTQGINVDKQRGGQIVRQKSCKINKQK